MFLITQISIASFLDTAEN